MQLIVQPRFSVNREQHLVRAERRTDVAAFLFIVEK
jgi:hypothetical protein